MKIIVTLTFFLISLNTLAQNNLHLKSFDKDSIIKNRYSKGKIYFGGTPGGGVLYKKNVGIAQYGINNSSELGYFVSNKTLLLLHSFYSYGKSLREEHKGINVWGISSGQSLTVRRYFHPEKISFFSEVSLDYNNFYSKFTFYTGLPPKWFHIGSVSGGGGINLFIYKFDLQVGFKYRYPIFYKDEATHYTDFGLIPGIDFIIGTYFTF